MANNFFTRLGRGVGYIFTGRNDFFGPGEPLQTIITPDEADRAGVTGRQFDFPVATNLMLTPRGGEPVTFAQLRSLADNLDILRLVIETRKDQIARLKWRINPKQGAQVPDSRLDELNRFFRRPDRVNSWGAWLRMLLEDLFVIDAVTIYPRRDKGGALYALEPVDGATIKRIIDQTGRTPDPPYPAYQQVLKGVPAANYTRSELIYRPRNVRTHKLYGFSPVEQIMLTVNIAIRRSLHQLNYYTEGNVPEALCGVPETWLPDQIAHFQLYFDSLLQGNSANRRRMIFIPGGMKVQPTKDGNLKDEMDEWLARVVCFCFSLPPTPFSRQMNRATAETQQEAATAEGLLPTMEWVKELADDLLMTELDAPDCELVWGQEKSVDQLVQAQIDKIYVDIKVQTPAQIAEQRGLEYKPDGQDGNPQMTQMGADQFAKVSKLDSVHSPRRSVLTKASPPLRMKRLDPIPFDRPIVTKAQKALQKTLSGFFADEGPRIAAEICKALAPKQDEIAIILSGDSPLEGGQGGVKKTDTKKKKLRDLVDPVIDELDFGGWSVLFAPTTAQLEKVTADSGMRALDQFRLSEEGITDLVHERAVEIARERAANMVGMRLVDGELIDNPNPVKAITDSTRDMLRDLVTTSLQEGPSSQELAKTIENSLGFSAERAEMIARTELGNAHSEGSLEGYKAARDAGINVYLEWLAGSGDSCDECQENADADMVVPGDEFPSGDTRPLAHPRCTCALCPAVVTAQDVEDQGEEPYK